MRQRLKAPVYTEDMKKRVRIDRERHQKMRQLRLGGQEPFPDARLPARSLAAEIHTEHDPRALESGEHPRWRYTVAGRLMARRKHRHATFFDLRDQSGIIELCVRRDNPDEARCSPLIGADLGDILTAEGTVYVTDNHTLTISVVSSQLLAKALRLPPGRSARADSEPRGHQRDLSLLANEPTRRLVETRSAAATAVRVWMAENLFVETGGPMLDALAARPLVARQDASRPRGSSRFSPRLGFRRCLLGGLERVYALEDRSRDEISGCPGDVFTILDWATAYIDYEDAARQVEEIIQRVALAIGPSPIARSGETTIDLSPPWQSITVRESISRQCGIDVLTTDASALARWAPAEADLGTDSWGSLVNGIYTAHVEPKLMQPTIVRDFPLTDQMFARTHPGFGKLACNFVAVIGGVEVAGGDSELNDPHEQRARLTADEAGTVVDSDRAVAHRDREVWLLEYGLCPAAYAMLYIDRLISLLTDESPRPLAPGSEADIGHPMTKTARPAGIEPVSAA
jgi:lysyl-tRNA synthetase, class II